MKGKAKRTRSDDVPPEPSSEIKYQQDCLHDLRRHLKCSGHSTPGCPVYCCQEAALTRHIAWRQSRGGVGLGPSGKQLHPATPELTAWQERPADGSQ